MTLATNDIGTSIQRLLNELLVKPIVLFLVDDYIDLFYLFYFIFLMTFMSFCNVTLSVESTPSTTWTNCFLDIPIQKPLKSNKDILILNLFLIVLSSKNA